MEAAGRCRCGFLLGAVRVAGESLGRSAMGSEILPSLTVCPNCRGELGWSPDRVGCQSCGNTYALREGIPVFLGDAVASQDLDHYGDQVLHWSETAGLRDHVRRGRWLSFLNDARIRFSMSGRRDRIFRTGLRKSSPGSLILDLGCGGGRHYFTRYGRVIGLDSEFALLRQSRQLYEGVVLGSALSMPFKDGAFDAVVSSDVIGHIPNELKPRLLEEMYRVLKPGGRTIHVIETDSQCYWFRFAKRYPERFREVFIERPGHIGLELPSVVRRRFLEAGFEEVRCLKYAGNVWDCGALLPFRTAYAGLSPWVDFCAGVSAALGRNLAVRELCNLILEPVARLSDRFTPLDHGIGLLAIFRKPE